MLCFVYRRMYRKSRQQHNVVIIISNQILSGEYQATIPGSKQCKSIIIDDSINILLQYQSSEGTSYCTIQYRTLQESTLLPDRL